MNKTISCLIVDDEPVAREILKEHLSKIEQINVVAYCKNAIEAFKYLSAQPIDLIFLDINMPEISGLDFAKTINRNIKVIFTTAYRDYAVEGFDLKAVDYLLKPISFERLLQALNKFTEENMVVQSANSPDYIEEKNDFIFVRSDRKMVRINFYDIAYIESLSDYIKIHLDQQIVITRETISNIEIKLPSGAFIRTHRSYIVALDKITSFTNEYVEIDTKMIPVSRSYKTEVMQKLEAFE
ncbi:LytR/AlgR family response regulator transcription factor [Plebeiibacterium marinum]|uniref:LytTR family DNA-binding domain-containing protein n=1 Tax=Plebeiibacterium marinum TaxID=2992111 RepID=A0AAE3MFH4_9BACT|nr:LytTR family DNA-binding domain-containing protein [Plebeiobacterium marinum]MCW3807018.1 LytTR family DNA-binding domain-containing protein [Plebeiobacterium marinum]